MTKVCWTRPWWAESSRFYGDVYKHLTSMKRCVREIQNDTLNYFCLIFQDYFVKKLHWMLTSMIINMPLKVSSLVISLELNGWFFVDKGAS